MDQTTGEVCVGSERIELTTTEFRLLQVLVNHRDAVVAQGTLEQIVWGAALRSSRVTKQTQGLRRKLGDSAQQPRWIGSVRGVGYRFIGPALEGAAAETAKSPSEDGP
jgi:DNA-binding response OmpR family regulator